MLMLLLVLLCITMLGLCQVMLVDSFADRELMLS